MDMRIMAARPARFGVLLLAAAILVLASAPADAGSRKIALGVTMRSTSLASYDAFTQSAGRAPAIWMLWRDWLGTGSNSFPNVDVLNHMSNQGTVPMLTWMPWDRAVLNRPR